MINELPERQKRCVDRDHQDEHDRDDNRRNEPWLHQLHSTEDGCGEVPPRMRSPRISAGGSGSSRNQRTADESDRSTGSLDRCTPHRSLPAALKSGHRASCVGLTMPAWFALVWARPRSVPRPINAISTNTTTMTQAATVGLPRKPLLPPGSRRRSKFSATASLPRRWREAVSVVHDRCQREQQLAGVASGAGEVDGTDAAT
jgi:hypothetical protein